MKLMQKSICALAVLAATATSFTTQAADSVDLKVIGTITPGACTPTISGGGVIDYGTIKADSLAATGLTKLSVKSATLSISCTAETKMAIKAVDQRIDSVAGTTVTGATGGGAPAPASLAWANYPVVGLGLNGTKKIGGYTVYLKGSPTADGQNATAIHAEDAGHQTWGTMPAGSSVYGSSSTLRYVSLADSANTSEPKKFTNATFPLSIQGYINEKSELDLTKNITLDGMTTLEIIYL